MAQQNIRILKWETVNCPEFLLSLEIIDVQYKEKLEN